MCFRTFAVTWSDLCLILSDDWTPNLVVRGRVGERGRSGPGDGAGWGGGEARLEGEGRVPLLVECRSQTHPAPMCQRKIYIFMLCILMNNKD